MKKVYLFVVKSMICMILFLVLGIICKLNYNYREYIQRMLYHEYFDFSNIKSFYDRYLGGVFPIDNISNRGVTPVFDEGLIYKDVIDYDKGAMLEVDYNYLVPTINSGLVIYIGEKEKYGNVVIVEGNDGIDIWYGNLCNIMVKLYDVVNSSDYLGESCDNKLYVVYTKKNEFLDYEVYLN